MPRNCNSTNAAPDRLQKPAVSVTQVAPGGLSQGYTPCTMNRRAKSLPEPKLEVKATPWNHGPDPALLFAEVINTSAAPREGSRTPAGPSPQSTGETPFSERGKEPISPQRESRSLPSSMTVAAHPPCGSAGVLQALQSSSSTEICTKTQGTGTIFRPLLTMTSGKTSMTEPFASATSTAGTTVTRLNRGRELAAQFPQHQGSSEPMQVHDTHGIQNCATNKSHEDRFAQDSDGSVQFLKSSWWL